MERPYGVQSAAEATGLHPETIRSALRSGKLHGQQTKKHGTWRIRPACLEDWVYNGACEHLTAKAA